MPLASREMLIALREVHPRHEYAFFEEFRVAAGAGLGGHDSRVDAIAIGTAKGVEFARIAYEVKANRSDFLREIKNPEKRRMALHLSNLYYFVTPKGLVQISELPAEAGLYEIWEEPNQGHLVCELVRDAIWRDAEAPNIRFLASLARRTRQIEEDAGKIREVHMLHEVARLSKEIDRIGFLEKLDEIHRKVYGYPSSYLEETAKKLRAALKRADEYIEKVR